MYNHTTYVDPNKGICGHETVGYGGTDELTPLFGEVVLSVAYRHWSAESRQVSMHLRGPMNVSQLAVYQLPGDMHTLQERHTVPFYNRQRATEKRKTNTEKLLQQSALAKPSHRRTLTVTSEPNEEPQGTPTAKQADTAPGRGFIRRAADWNRVAYYTSASPADATGLSFLANLGDPRKSGTFDYAFGNSLSYVSSNGGVVAPESMPFDGTLATSEREIAVFSDKACDQDCPYWRPNATSHFGWAGSSKAFFIEFQMDHYQNTGTDQGMISDAPAWWFLNAAIPRILQYGSDRNNVPCSCWSTGCGEFDAFEVLGKGEERAKSTLHRQGNLEGGDSNYFRRPVGRMLKFAVIWTFPNITALVLDDDFDFSESLSDDQIRQLVSYDPDSWVHSLFAIGD
ncbi:hypothetical protein HBI49_016560 [Parastagonospora nodorum]|nr:hypothetical protein HBH51_221290 [Parastagonospora nodorum]KAH4034416.1 hypothetical protein HBI09_110280 [Parastagonospora nodorum]KAH4169469.1 hypothetical protein HBH43_117840 [Parastagonospora nodorum]KAH4802993.1 hypothetical protein HBH61_182040 [Parastagonospora nodorum]KAH5013028.1 hypothetical protein HBI77_074650 [Parastagonospora nodorum]